MHQTTTIPFENDLTGLVIGPELANRLGVLIETARSHFRPRDFAEYYLVDEMALSKWRGMRVRTRFTELIAQGEANLHPQGMMEISFAAQILTALWRLERNPDWTEADRARIENSLRRNTAQLGRLQTNRQLKLELNLAFPGLVSANDILKHLKREKPRKNEENTKRKYEPISENLKAVEADLQAEINEEEQKQLAEFAKRVKIVPRNAPCPCGSRQKHKRCCGRDSPPVYGLAA